LTKEASMNLNPILPHAAAYAARCEHELLSAAERGTVARRRRPSLIARALQAMTAAFARTHERPLAEPAAWRRTPSRSN
jgi:hypothetical protein